jgi:Lar family restriction alleviation protein
MPNELKPCPFCGGKANIVFSSFSSRYMISCSKCGAITGFRFITSKREVQEAYNERGVDNV